MNFAQMLGTPIAPLPEQPDGRQAYYDWKVHQSFERYFSAFPGMSFTASDVVEVFGIAESCARRQMRLFEKRGLVERNLRFPDRPTSPTNPYIWRLIAQ